MSKPFSAVRRLLAGLLMAACASSAAPAADEDRWLSRIEGAEQTALSTDPEAGLRQLDALVVEALGAGRTEAQIQASLAHARVKLRLGRTDGVRRELEETLVTARQFGVDDAEAALTETYADYWFAAGDLEAATGFLRKSVSLALSQPAPDPGMARRILRRLIALHRSLGQSHLVARTQAWLDLLDGSPDAAPTGVELEPRLSTVTVAPAEIARTRLVLANATPLPVTGTLVLDAGGTFLAGWKTGADADTVVLRCPENDAILPSATEARQITLRPGEDHGLFIELEPGQPPRELTKRIKISWIAGPVTTTAEVTCRFESAAASARVGVSNTSSVHLSPYVAIPVYEEIYFRDASNDWLENFVPATDKPCRIEIYELSGGTSGTETRRLIAIDADGDGEFKGAGDRLLTDRDHDAVPDVKLSANSPVVALELLLYPLSNEAGEPLTPDQLRLGIALEHGSTRSGTDAVHQIRTR